MLLFNVFKKYGQSIFCKNCRVNYFGKIAANQYNQIINFSKSCYIIQEKKLLQTTITIAKTNNVFKRVYSSKSDQNTNDSPILLTQLTDDPLFTTPDFFLAIPSCYYLWFVLKSKLDNDFNMREFVDGSKHAVMVVSNALARENYDKLVGLVTDNVIDKLKEKISTLSQEQKLLIPIHKNDIYATYPRNIEVIYEGEGESQRIFAEITMVYCSLKGLSEIQTQHEQLMPLKLMPDYERKVIVSNYKFRRDYTNSTSEPWVITLCNEAMMIAL